MIAAIRPFCVVALLALGVIAGGAFGLTLASLTGCSEKNELPPEVQAIFTPPPTSEILAETFLSSEDCPDGFTTRTEGSPIGAHWCMWSKPTATPTPTPHITALPEWYGHDFAIEYPEPVIETCTCLAIEAETGAAALASFVDLGKNPIRCEPFRMNCKTVYALTIDVAGERVFSLEMANGSAP